MSIPELLVKDGFITRRDQEKIEEFSATSGQSFVKIALNYGYISRKNYERSMTEAGYTFAAIREMEFDPEVLSKIELKFAEQNAALPLRIEHGRVITVMAD